MSDEERALMAAALLDGGGARVLARVHDAAEVRAAVAALQARPRDERLRTIVAEVRRLRAVALPAEVAERASAHEPALLRASRLAEPAVRRWAARALLARFSG